MFVSSVYEYREKINCKNNTALSLGRTYTRGQLSLNILFRQK